MLKPSHFRVGACAFFLGVAAILGACSTATVKNPPGPESTPTDTPGGGDGEDAGGGTPSDRDPSADLGGKDLALTSAITIQVEPSDKAAAVIAAIKGAKTSVHMTMYLLTNDTVMTALINLHKAGKDVKVVLNKTFPDGTDQGGNDEAFGKLDAAGVPVVWAPPDFQYTHAKTVVIDGTTALIMTMNLTITSPTNNREFIATDTDPDDVAVAEQVFEGDFAGTGSVVTGKLVLSPKGSSDFDPATLLGALIDSSKQTLDLEGETLSDDGIVAKLIAAQNAGVAVRVVVDGNNSGTSAQKDAIAELVAAGVPVKLTSEPYIHAKAVVADGARAYVGSQNFTTNSLENNREIGLLTDAVAEIAKVTDAISTDFAAGADP